MRRLSTNEKLAGVINAKDYEEDDDIIVARREEEKRAIERVRKNAFYGQGSRAKIPKVKKKVSDQSSPFTVLEPLFLPPKSDMLGSVVQPGAHQDQYRIMVYPTEKCRNDPERVFYTTTGFTEGIQFSHQPPWYFGYRNTTKPADANMMMAANRYGFRGSKDIKQRHTEPFEVPSRTRTEHTPAFLDRNDMIDEWVPPILAAKYGTINNLETPKLWPENAEFVTGSKMKKTPSYPSYNRETTVGQSFRPSTSQQLNTVIDNADAMDATLQDFCLKEKTREAMCLPQAAKTQYEVAWSERVVKTANPALRQTMRRVLPPYEAHTLMDPSDTMRYSGSTAMIVHTQTSEEVKFRLRMQRSESMISYDLKWKLVMQQFKQLKGYVKKEVTASVLIREVGNVLRKLAKAANTPTSVTRLQFITGLSRMHCFEMMTEKNLSALYSVFDPMKHNSVRYAELVLALGLFDHPLQAPLEKMGYLWDLMAEYGNDEPPIAVALSVLACGCGNDVERKQVEALFKSEFKPIVYRMSVDLSGTVIDTSAEVAELFGQSTSTNKGGSSRASSSSKPYRNAAANIHAHNITDQYLNQDTFVNAMAQCPKLKDLFDQLLTTRLRALYGKDARYDVEEEDDKVDGRDFSWILDNKRAAAAAFAAAAAANAGKHGQMLHPQHWRHHELLQQYTGTEAKPA